MTKSTPADRRRAVSEVIGATIGFTSILVLFGAVTAGVVILVKVLAGPRIPLSDDPLNVIFASRLLVAVIRLGILTFVFYAIYSMLHFMRRGQPLSRVGPVQVGEAVEAVTRERDALKEQVNGMVEENKRLEGETSELRGRLQESVKTLNSVLQYLQSDADKPNAGEEDP